MGFTGAMFRDVWESIANRGLDLISKRFAASASLTTVCRELLSEKGEASGAALARRVAELYDRAAPAVRDAFFFSLLQQDFLPDPSSVIAAADGYRANPNSDTLARLTAAVDPPRQELFRRINLAPGGTRLIVRMREDLMKLLRQHPELRSVDADFHHLLSSWFNRGFLRLERIDWRTPAIVLEKLIEHEAVHEIHGWDDLRRRLAGDRRCFAFFHPALPDEPLIFVEVALTQGLPPSVQFLLDRNTALMDPSRADTAVFYSINNCLVGLRGIYFGNFLIKQVVAELEAEKLPVRTFVTLSPIPGFRRWMERAGGKTEELLGGNTAAPAVLDGLRTVKSPVNSPSTTAGITVASTVTAAVPDGRKNTVPDGIAVPESARPALLKLAAHYLLHERKQDRALDPVAAFHLGNGAAVEQINWMADTSPKGIEQSFGMMVNYAYRPWQIERNHEAYMKRGKVAASARVRDLVEQPIPKPRE
jgi:malonyl-CoA decarboxylase